MEEGEEEEEEEEEERVYHVTIPGTFVQVCITCNLHVHIGCVYYLAEGVGEYLSSGCANAEGKPHHVQSITCVYMYRNSPFIFFRLSCLEVLRCLRKALS